MSEMHKYLTMQLCRKINGQCKAVVDTLLISAHGKQKEEEGESPL